MGATLQSITPTQQPPEMYSLPVNNTGVLGQLGQNANPLPVDPSNITGQLGQYLQNNNPAHPSAGMGPMPNSPVPQAPQSIQNPYAGAQYAPSSQQYTPNYSAGGGHNSTQSHISGMNQFNEFRDSAYEQAMRQINPQMTSQKRDFDQQMLARGIEAGSDAYNNAFKNFSNQQNDLLSQAAYGAQGQALNAQNQFAQQDLTREGFANQRSIAGINAAAQRYGVDARTGLGYAQLGEQGRQADNNLGFQYAGLDQNNNQFNSNLGFQYAGLNQAGQQFSDNLGLQYSQLDSQNMHQMGNFLLDNRRLGIDEFNAQQGAYNNWWNQSGGMLGQAPGGSFTPIGNVAQGVQQAGQNQANAQSQQNQALGGILAGLIGLSDQNQKENITYVDTVDDVNVYEFNYKDEVGIKGRYRGVLAQEVQGSHPDSVIDQGGVLVVDYSKLPVNMEQVYAIN